MEPVITKLKEKGYLITKKNSSSAKLEINDVNLLVTLYYPSEISYNGQRFYFEPYTEKFEKIAYYMPEDTKEKTLTSTDGNFEVIPQNDLSLSNIFGEPADTVSIIVADKNELNGNDLYGNLVYGIRPIGYISETPINIRFDLEESAPEAINSEDTKIEWYEPTSQTWNALENTKQKDSIISIDTRYATYYGIGKSKSAPKKIPSISLKNNFVKNTPELIYTNDQSFNSVPSSVSSGSFTVPKKTYSDVSGNIEQIYNKIKDDMEATYPLILNPDCSVPFNGAFCYTGNVNECGSIGIHCNSQTYAQDDEFLNTLFRHELTHNLQQNNDGCAAGDPIREWGAEYYSASTYYKFIVNGKAIGSQDYADILKEKGCSDEDIMDLAFCKKGSYELECFQENKISAYTESGLS
jgi:predicted small metal-binding protein